MEMRICLRTYVVDDEWISGVHRQRSFVLLFRSVVMICSNARISLQYQ